MVDRWRAVGRAVVVAVSLAGGPAAAATAEDPGAAAPVRHATLRIDTSQVGDAGPVIKRRVEERGGIVLRRGGILPARDARDAVISVVVEELRGEEPGFVFELWVERGGTSVGERRRVECTLCTESEIVGRIEHTLVEATVDVDVDVPPPDDEPPPRAERVDATEGSPSLEPVGGEDDDGRGGLRTRGKVGVGLLTAGGVGLAVGLGFVLAEPRVMQSDPRRETSLRWPGVGVLAGSGAAIVAGAVLLVIDRRNARSRTTAVVPWLRGDGPGVVITARF